MKGLHWDFLAGMYAESKFFGRHYGGKQYWQTLRIDHTWSELYLMGGEL